MMVKLFIPKSKQGLEIRTEAMLLEGFSMENGSITMV